MLFYVIILVCQSLCQIILLIILYFLAPTFVKEKNLVRLAENRLLEYCYEYLPGKTKVNNIIYGTDPKWTNDNSLKGKKEFSVPTFSISDANPYFTIRRKFRSIL